MLRRSIRRQMVGNSDKIVDTTGFSGVDKGNLKRKEVTSYA